MKVEPLEHANPFLLKILCAVTTNVFVPSVKDFGAINIYTHTFCVSNDSVKIKERDFYKTNVIGHNTDFNELFDNKESESNQ